MNNQDLEKIKDTLKGKHIFIAYIEEDKNVAHLIWDRLNELGAVPWAYTKNDDNIRWRKEIVRTIRNSDVMILVFSKKTDDEANKHIVKEVGLASKNKLTIIPFMIDEVEDIKNEALAYELEGINWIRKTDPIERQIDLLIVRLVKYFGGTATPPPPPPPPSNKKWLYILLSIAILGIAGYLLMQYFNNSNNTYNEKLYVCYDKKLTTNSNTQYTGCKLYPKPCNNYNKEHFGHYPTQKESLEALNRCINSEPKIVTTKDSIKQDEIEKFITNYYKANEDTIHIKQVLNFYSNKLDNYFGQKNIDKLDILDGLVAYTLKNPERSYKVDKIYIINTNTNSANALVTVNWTKKDRYGKESSGITIQKVTLLKENKKLSIKSIETYNKIVMPKTENISNKETTNNNTIIKQSKTLTKDDLTIRTSDATNLIGKPTILIEFGGYKTPLCKLAVSKDGTKFYFNEVNSKCIKMTNSKKINIVCNIRQKGKKQICKTYKEIKELISSLSSNKIFDYKKDTLPDKIEFNPNHPENFIFFAKDRRSLSILRNLPFALKGYDFKTVKIANYYKKMPWYHPNPKAKNIQRSKLEQEWWNSIKKFKVTILRNLPYALKGVVFKKDKRLNIYFSQFDWYKPNKNYIPIFNNLSTEDKQWIKEMQNKDPLKYVDFFNLFNTYLKNR